MKSLQISFQSETFALGLAISQKDRSHQFYFSISYVEIVFQKFDNLVYFVGQRPLSNKFPSFRPVQLVAGNGPFLVTEPV
eukprot:403352266